MKDPPPKGGGLNARGHIFAVTAFNLQKAEWITGLVWTRRSEEKSAPLRNPGWNPGHPARSQVPCRLGYLQSFEICVLEKFKYAY